MDPLRATADARGFPGGAVAVPDRDHRCVVFDEDVIVLTEGTPMAPETVDPPSCLNRHHSGVARWPLAVAEQGTAPRAHVERTGRVSRRQFRIERYQYAL